MHESLSDFLTDSMDSVALASRFAAEFVRKPHIPLRVVCGDCGQSGEQFRYQAISGTYSVVNFNGDQFSVRPEADRRKVQLKGRQHSE